MDYDKNNSDASDKLGEKWQVPYIHNYPVFTPKTKENLSINAYFSNSSGRV
jgi:hypothetical protein